MGRDYLKCAVLCYNLDRWRFERSIRLGMEYKITWNKSARRKKFYLILNKVKRMYSPFLISVVLLGYFIVFAGFSGPSRTLHKTKSRLNRAITNGPCREVVFSTKFESAA